MWTLINDVGTELSSILLAPRSCNQAFLIACSSLLFLSSASLSLCVGGFSYYHLEKRQVLMAGFAIQDAYERNDYVLD